MQEMSELDIVHVDIWVHGYVQRVGFRWWTRCRALEIGLVGSATNKSDGRVHIVAEGSREDCEALVAALCGGGTPGRVDVVVENYRKVCGSFTGFSIR